MTRRTLFVALTILVFTLLGYARFPGHTYLQQDTLVYLPMFEHLDDPTALTRDLVATRPHLAFTIYDEVSIQAARTTGLDFRQVLAGQQILFRFLGILGVYMAASSLGLALRPALLVAGVFSLGATILGPSVLTFEYEPIPRGFALMLALLAMGCAAQERYLTAGIFGSLAFLYHPPTVYPFWLIYFLLALWPAKPELMLRRIRGLAPLVGAVILLLALSRLQPGVSERQSFFGILSPQVEQLQRMRAPYNWVGVWIGQYIWHYLFLFAVSMAAYFRLRRYANQGTRFFLLGLPVVGMLSLPLSYLLLDVMKWSLMAQFQPARAVLFVTVAAITGAAAAAMKSAEEGRVKECFAWAMAAFLGPVSSRVTEFFSPGLADPVLRARLLLLLGLAGVATLAAWMERRRPRLAAAPWLVAVLAGFFVIPGWGRVTNYPNYHSAELDQLAAWGAASTPKDALFQFPDAGRFPSPGIFRVKARRAIYADWKGGGQVNFLREFAETWWQRWQKTTNRKLDAEALRDFRSLGIDYVVVNSDHRIAGQTPVFENSRFVAYRLTQ